MKKLIVHIANIEVSEKSGVGRVVWHWKNALEKRGYEFLHIGKTQVGKLPHHAFFPYAAYKAYKRLGRKADAFLIHECASGPFMNLGIPVVIHSHGLERRAWYMALKHNDGAIHEINWKRKITFPLWNLRHCDLGFQKASLILICNQQDADFAKEYYAQNGGNYYVYRNGVNPTQIDEQVQPKNQCTILFLASWIKRKGNNTLVEAADILYKSGLRLNWLLAATGLEAEKVLADWPNELKSSVEVIPFYLPNIEESFLARSNIFVLPSVFEGQCLSLLQAMETGRCCITTNCCGQLDLIQHNYNGLLHDPSNAQQLASLIKQCVTNESMRIELGRNAKNSVKGRSWESVSAAIVDRIENQVFNLAKSS
jgi:glycosyltransferase involved in cell wall biosynthesis